MLDQALYDLIEYCVSEALKMLGDDIHELSIFCTCEEFANFRVSVEVTLI